MKAPTNTHCDIKLESKPIWQKRALTAAVALFVVAGLYLLSLITEEDVLALTERLGPWGPALIAGFILLTQVFAPLTGTPGLFVGFKLYGFPITMLIFYFTSMISAVINFYLARIFGRKVVLRLVGAKTLSAIDKLAQSEERVLLIVSRVFGYYLFDIVSYAVGLTSIAFPRYLLYTAVFSLLPFGLYFLIFMHVDFDHFTGMLAYYVSLLVTGAMFTRYFWKLYGDKRKPHQDGPRINAEFLRPE